MQQPSSLWSRLAPPVVRNLIVINLIIWVASIVLLRRGIDLNDLLGLHYFAADKFRFFQLVSYTFLHSTSSLEHVLSNMFAVWMFGSTIEQVWGSRMYELSGIEGYQMVDIGTEILSTRAFLDLLITVGASGSVFGLLLAYGMLFPNSYVFVGFFIPLKAKYFVLIYGALELYLGTHNTGGSVAHFAHLGGMIGGLILILLWRKRGEISRQSFN